MGSERTCNYQLLIMNYFIKYFVILLLLFVFGNSCKKYVEIPPPDDKITAGQVYASTATIDAAMTGLYQFAFGNEPSSQSEYPWGVVDQYIAVAADDAINGSPEYDEFYQNIYPSTDATLGKMWTGPYLAIGRANGFIEGVTGSTVISEEKKNNYLAQARLTRAYYYFILSNLFGDVPLPLGTDVNQTSVLPRVSRTLVDTAIMSDLLFARDHLTADQGSDNFTFNQHAANAMLARMYGYKKDWAAEKTAADAIIGSNRYALVKDPVDVYTTGNSEAIFQVSNVGTYYEGTIIGSFFDRGLIVTLTPGLLSLYGPDDLRLPAWTVFDGTNYAFNKFTYPPANPQAQVLMRLADVVLLRAEARAQLNELDDAIDDINLIRERAGIADLPHGLTQTEVIQGMMDERRKEFFAEDITRWFDLSRWGIIQSTMKAAKPTTWTEKAALFPVMKNELSLNPKLTQTPGY